MFLVLFEILAVSGICMTFLFIKLLFDRFSNWLSTFNYINFQTPYQWYSIDPQRNLPNNFLMLRTPKFNQDYYYNYELPNNTVLLSRQLMTDSQVLDYWYTFTILESEYQELVDQSWNFIRNPDPLEPHPVSLHRFSMTGSQMCQHFFWVYLIKCQRFFYWIQSKLRPYLFLILPQFYFYLVLWGFLAIFRKISSGVSC